MRVLLAEDDQSIAELLVDILTDEGFQVSRVTTPEAALKLAASASWDVVLTDTFGRSYQPDSPDLAFMRTLATRVPVVVLTAQPWAERVQPGDLGVSAIIAKPFDMDHLVSVLRGS
jgi:DNA-binding response OmpR family regulator